MKKLSITAFIFALFASMSTYAACIPHDVAEGEVSGKQYTMENSPNPAYPVILGFSSDNTAFLGSQLDGHPGGEYIYKGDCHGYIKLYFKSYFGENKQPKLIMHLKPSDVQYFKLIDIYNKDNVFVIKVKS